MADTAPARSSGSGMKKVTSADQGWFSFRRPSLVLMEEEGAGEEEAAVPPQPGTGLSRRRHSLQDLDNAATAEAPALPRRSSLQIEGGVPEKPAFSMGGEAIDTGAEKSSMYKISSTPVWKWLSGPRVKDVSIKPITEADEGSSSDLTGLGESTGASGIKEGSPAPPSGGGLKRCETSPASLASQQGVPTVKRGSVTSLIGMLGLSAAKARDLNATAPTNW